MKKVLRLEQGRARTLTLGVQCSLGFEAVLRVAVKQKVPQAAAVAPRPHKQQHAAVGRLHTTTHSKHSARKHEAPAVGSERARLYGLEECAAARKVAEDLAESEAERSLQ
jgi:hypothetical protein